MARQKTPIKIITRTALLLALTIIFQGMGRLIPAGVNSNFVVGPLVNACLIIAASFVGLYGASLIAVAAPFGAILTGAAVPLLFAPFIALGNLVLVVLFYFLQKKGFLIGLFSGAFLKFLTLYASVLAFTNLAKIPAKKASALILAFGWPQLVTALMGGAIALIIIMLLKAQGINKEAK